ncbi:MAG TPA: PH domain-containing protein [Tepidisphaeraceae bacterium]|jgi:hypothetical protein
MNDRLKGWRLMRRARSRRGQRRSRWGAEPVESCSIHGTEAGLAAAPVAAPPAVSTSLATLLTRHVLRDGEIILLILKPSLWTILFNSLPAVAAALIVMISTGLWLPHHTHIGIEVGMMLIALRAGAAIMTWAGKLYLLTDLRIVKISGVFTPQIHDIPLRKIARTRLVAGFHEKLCRVASIEIIPESDQWPWSVWQSVPKPLEVHETIRRTITRAKQGCGHALW